MSNYQDHGFHLVDPSPWPIVTATAALTWLSGSVMWFHGYNNGGLIASTGLVFLFLSAAIWWRDIIREGTFEGHHTCLLYTSPSPRDGLLSRMPSSA